MISEASCDTEDWSNDARIQLCHHRNKFHNITVFTVFLSNKVSLDEHKKPSLKIF